MAAAPIPTSTPVDHHSSAGGGLDDVVACESSITLIDGPNGELFFRGYAVEDLAAATDYLEVVHLLWHGQWPTSAEHRALERRLQTQRSLPPAVDEILRLIAGPEVNPMAVVRTVTSMLGALDPQAEDTEPAAVLDSAVALLARMPNLIATLARRRQGLEPIAPDAALGHVANYLYMLRGDRPSAEEVAGLNTLMILHMEHELNASTFAARTVVGTLSDYYSAITAAICALKGRRHGGAIDAVVPLLREIGSPEAVPTYVERALNQGRKLPGFGHRVYRHRDPRAALQAGVARRLTPRSPEPVLFEVAQRLEAEMLARRGLPANVDYYAALGLAALGFPPELFTSFIASTRVAGWTAHVFEQLDNNRLIRPRAHYRGPRGLSLGAQPWQPH
jgi:citrate synthase